MRISGGGGASSHHESTHSNSHTSHSAVSHHEAPARSAPARSAPARRENPAPAHHSEPARDTVSISPQAARLERLMSSQDKITQSSPKPAPRPEKKENSGGFWSKLVDKVSNVAQKVEQTTKEVEQAVSKETGHVEQAAKQVAREAVQSTKAVLQEAKHVETKAANVIQRTAHDAKEVAEKAENSVDKNAHNIASKVEQVAVKADQAVQKDAKVIASKVSKEAEKIGHSAVTELKNAEHTLSQGLKAAGQRERKIANGIAKDVQSVEQKVQSGAKHLEKRAIQAYQATQKAVGQAIGDVQHSAHQADQEIDKIGIDIGKGVKNLAAHPGATISATMSVAGGVTEAVAGAALGTATSETGIGLVVGSAVAIDGGAHALAGLGDLASIFNGNVSKIGTHNFLENTAGRIGGQTGRNIYDTTSTMAGLVIPGADVNAMREIFTSVSSHTKELASAAKEIITNAIPSGPFRPALAGNSALIGGHMKFEPVRMENSTQMTMAKTLYKPSVVADKGTGKTAKPLELSDFTKEQMGTKPMNSPIPENWYKKGGSITIDEKGTWTYTNKSGQSVSYPNGFPDFSQYVHPNVKPVEIEVATPKNPQADFKAANEKAGLNKDSNPSVPASNKPPEGYSWHHHEDGKTMILVDEDIHREFKHIGGQSTINGKNGMR